MWARRRGREGGGCIPIAKQVQIIMYVSITMSIVQTFSHYPCCPYSPSLPHPSPPQELLSLAVVLVIPLRMLSFALSIPLLVVLLAVAIGSSTFVPPFLSSCPSSLLLFFPCDAPCSLAFLVLSLCLLPLCMGGADVSCKLPQTEN